MAYGSRSHSTSQLRDSRSFLFYFLLFWNVKIYVQQSNTAYQSTNLSMGCIKIRWHDWYSLEFFKLGGGKVYFPGRDQKKRKFYQERPPKWLNTEIPGWNWHGYGWLSIIRITGVGESELGSEQAPGTLHLRRRWITHRQKNGSLIALYLGVQNFKPFGPPSQFFFFLILFDCSRTGGLLYPTVRYGHQ